MSIEPPGDKPRRMEQSPRSARGSGKDRKLDGNRNFSNSRWKIAEEWVNRDELGMLIELGVVKTSAVSESK
jgi:hypothetical protein